MLNTSVKLYLIFDAFKGFLFHEEGVNTQMLEWQNWPVSLFVCLLLNS